MHSDQLIKERAMPRIIRDICARRGIDCQTLSDDWILRLERAGRVSWVIGGKFDLNTAAANRLAEDKAATYAVLQAAGVPAIEHYPVRIPRGNTLIRPFDTSVLPPGPVVLKPLDSSGGRAVVRYESVDEAIAAIESRTEPAWAISPYYELATEYRIVLLDGRTLVSFEKIDPMWRGGLKLFNLGQGGKATDITDTVLLARLEEIARRVMRVMCLRLAAVDIVRTEGGELRVLEVNDGIAMEHYLEQRDEYRVRAEAAYDAIVAALF